MPQSQAEASQRERLEQYIAQRNAGERGAAMARECEKLTEMAGQGVKAGYCEQIVAALRAGATEGEIVKALEAVWGRYRPGM